MAASLLVADSLGGLLSRGGGGAFVFFPGGDSVCRVPGLWEEALFRNAEPLLRFEGVPLLDAHADEARMSLVVLYLIVFLGMVAFLRLQGKRILPMLFTYVFGRRRVSGLVGEDLRQEYGNVWLTLLVGYSSLAMGISFLGGFSWRIMGLALLGLMLYQLLLSVLIVFLGWVFNASRCASEACLALCAANAVTSLVLSPFVLSLFFVWEHVVPELLRTLYVLLAICLIFKWIRLFGILFEFKISVFYMILYLCTLEITPWLVTYKLLG